MKKRGQTMIALMIVIVIILILLVVFFHPTSNSPRKDKLGYTAPGFVRLSSLDIKCKSDLDQDRLAIQTFKASDADGNPPASLDDLHLPAEMLSCPVGHEKYVYDPTTGTVHCPHPGHEKY